MGDLLYSRTKWVCVLVLLTLWGPKIPKSPHKDSKTRKILPRGVISHVLIRTEAIVSLGVRFRGRVTIKVRIRVRIRGEWLGVMFMVWFKGRVRVMFRGK